MKKFFFLLSFALVMLAITSCSGRGSTGADTSDDATEDLTATRQQGDAGVAGLSTTPKGTVEVMLRSLKNLDVEAALSYCCDDDGEPLMVNDNDLRHANEIKGILETFEYTVGDEHMSPDGLRASVDVTISLLDQETTQSLICILGDDGRWRVCFNAF